MRRGDEAVPDATGQAATDLGGEAAGEVGAVGTPFFVSKKAAAVLKHAILEKYVVPFASKVGSTSKAGRVAYLDGYAGPGRYADGTMGSPALILESARAIAGYRQLQCHFVEKKRSDFTLLKALLDEKRGDLLAFPYHGRVEDRLDDILTAVSGLPLFAFLDPFGLSVTFEHLTKKILGGERGPNGPATEMLLNFSANAVRRIGGLLSLPSLTPTQQATLSRMDKVVGDDWWRRAYSDADSPQQALEVIAQGYADRVCTATNSGGWVMPVRNRKDLQPVYYLLHTTRHRDGLFLFGEASSSALKEWRRACTPPPKTDDPATPTLFEVTDPFEDEEAAREHRWRDHLRDNMLTLLAERQEFDVGDCYSEIFGDFAGEARMTHLRAVLKELHVEGRTQSDSKGTPLWNKIVRRA